MFHIKEKLTKLENLKNKIEQDIISPSLEQIRVMIRDIDETLRLSKDFDGTKAKAEIKNGILFIKIDKKESKKPKQLQIKF